MGRKQRLYSRVTEASEMIKDLCEKHPEAFWCVKPEAIAVMGIDNVERSEKAVAKSPVWSKLRNIKGVEANLLKENDIRERFILEIFWSDWNEWKEEVKAAVLAQHLFEITTDFEVKNSPDCVGFNILYKALGVNWQRATEKGLPMPNILRDDIEFDLELRPGLEELEASGEEDGPEDPDANL